VRQGSNAMSPLEHSLSVLAKSMLARVDAACAPATCPLLAAPPRLPDALTARSSSSSSSSSTGTLSESIGPHVMLDGGVAMPRLGLGTWMTVGADCRNMVVAAIRAGIRHIDTSENYANVEEIGAALREVAAEVPRSELFLADKVSFASSYSAAGVRKTLAASLAALGTTYLDLLMLHSIGPSTSAQHEAWREMEALKTEGKVRAIGTSNFGTHDMQALRAVARVPPQTAQIKFNPYHQGRTGNAAGEDFTGDCASGGCVVVAYCPLNAWPSKLAPVDDPHVAAIAHRLGRTPAQVLLRWGLQRGAAVLTRSRDAKRLHEATQIFDFALSSTDMARLSGLAWLVESSQHKPAASVVDVYGVQQLARAATTSDERVEL